MGEGKGVVTALCFLMITMGDGWGRLIGSVVPDFCLAGVKSWTTMITNEYKLEIKKVEKGKKKDISSARANLQLLKLPKANIFV